MTIKTKRLIAYDEFNSAFSGFETELNQLNLGQSLTDNIIQLFKSLLNSQTKLCESLVEDDVDLSREISVNVNIHIAESNSHAMQKLLEIGSAYKRKKRLQLNPMYVAPKEKGLGLKWRTKYQPDSDMPNYIISQT